MGEWRAAARAAAAASTAGQVADVVDASEDAGNQTDAAQVSTFEERHTENVAEEAAFEQNAPNLSYDEAEKSTEVGNASSCPLIRDEFCSNKSYHEAGANDEKDSVTKEDFVAIMKNLDEIRKRERAEEVETRRLARARDLEHLQKQFL